MKITTFCPSIITEHAEETIAMFEALGFERRHKKSNINDDGTEAVDMKHPDGFRVTVVNVKKLPTPQDMTTIRMNVDDLEETLTLLESKGFKNAQGEKITDTGSSRATMMVAPSGFSISVSKHIKDAEK